MPDVFEHTNLLTLTLTIDIKIIQKESDCRLIVSPGGGLATSLVPRGWGYLKLWWHQKSITPPYPEVGGWGLQLTSA